MSSFCVTVINKRRLSYSARNMWRMFCVLLTIVVCQFLSNSRILCLYLVYCLLAIQTNLYEEDFLTVWCAYILIHNVNSTIQHMHTTTTMDSCCVCLPTYRQALAEWGKASCGCGAHHIEATGCGAHHIESTGCGAHHIEATGFVVLTI